MIMQHGRQPFFGFTRAHEELANMSIAQITQPDDTAVERFEGMFAQQIGDGQAVAFATGRMGFYALMKQLKIGSGEEVILQGATCAVMASMMKETRTTTT